MSYAAVGSLAQRRVLAVEVQSTSHHIRTEHASSHIVIAPPMHSCMPLMPPRSLCGEDVFYAPVGSLAQQHMLTAQVG